MLRSFGLVYLVLKMIFDFLMILYMNQDFYDRGYDFCRGSIVLDVQFQLDPLFINIDVNAHPFDIE